MPVRVGVIGCGSISPIYFRTMKKFPWLEVSACASRTIGRAQERAREFGIPHVSTVSELLSDPGIDLIVNLTTPEAHAEITLAALEAGKHVYSEKPLASNLEDGRRILALAQKKQLAVGCAPDTILGAGVQTCKSLIDGGNIGAITGASAFMLKPAPERKHPNPEFLYRHGAGPLLDMGPYYLSALVTLLGPLSRVSGLGRITYPERTILSQPRCGEVIKVEVSTHVTAILEFAAGPIGTLITSFDTLATTLPPMEVYGSRYTLRVPDPDTFGGPVLVGNGVSPQWKAVPLQRGFATNSRGIGVAEMALALESHRCTTSGQLAYHVLEAMHGILWSAETGRHYTMVSTCPLPQSLSPEVLEFAD